MSAAVAFAARVVLALTLVVAAVAKLRAGPRTRAQMIALLGTAAGPAASVAVPFVELAIAVVLVVWWSFVPGVGAAVLLVAFSAMLVRAQARGLPCPCFGRSSDAVGPAGILRNAWLIALAVLATASPSGANVIAVVVAIAVFGAIAAFFVTVS